MSTVPPSVPPSGAPSGPQQGMSTFVKWLIGCTVGCFLLLLVTCGGVLGLGYWGARTLTQKAESWTAGVQESRARAAEIDALDQAHPPRLPEDLATAQLAPEDVERYLRVRRDLAPAMQGLADAIASIPLADAATLEDNPSLRSVVGTMKGTVEGIKAARSQHLALLQAARDVLAREGMGPTDLARMVEIVEWRSLRRPEALALGVPAFRRGEVAALELSERVAREVLARPAAGDAGPESARAKAETALRDITARLAEIRAEAERDVALSDATRAALDARRTELEALPAQALVALAPLSADGALMDSISSVETRGRWHWSGGVRSPEPRPDEQPGAASGPAP